MKNLIKVATVSLVALTLLIGSVSPSMAGKKDPRPTKENEGLLHWAGRQRCIDLYREDLKNYTQLVAGNKFRDCKRSIPVKWTQKITPGSTGPTLPNTNAPTYRTPRPLNSGQKVTNPYIKRHAPIFRARTR